MNNKVCLLQSGPLGRFSSILTFWTTAVDNCNTPLTYFSSLPTTIVLLFQLVKYLLYSHRYNLGRDSSETVVGNVEAWATSSCILLMPSDSPWIDAGCTISILMLTALVSINFMTCRV